MHGNDFFVAVCAQIVSSILLHTNTWEWLKLVTTQHFQLVILLGTGILQYSWKCRPLDSEDREINVWMPAGGKGVRGVDSSTLVITRAGVEHRGQYRCVISNDAGTVTSNPATLYVGGYRICYKRIELMYWAVQNKCVVKRHVYIFYHVWFLVQLQLAFLFLWSTIVGAPAECNLIWRGT